MDALYTDIALVELYDAINAARQDFDVYIKELPQAPAAILDVGCGTGTFALDLAGRGYAVTALDPAPHMVAAAKRKDTSKTVEWITGFASDVSAKRRFDAAIMTGHAFQCLLDDQHIVTLLGDVRERLHTGGSFWFESRNPAAEAWHRWTPDHAGPAITLNDGRSVQVVHEVLDVQDGRVTFQERYEFGQGLGTKISHSTLRFLDLHEITAFAVASGFEVAATFGDWSRAPVSDHSPEIIVRLVRPA